MFTSPGLPTPSSWRNTHEPSDVVCVLIDNEVVRKRKKICIDRYIVENCKGFVILPYF